MNIADRIMNRVIFGNPEGTPDNSKMNKPFTKYDGFIKEVFYPKPSKRSVEFNPLREIERDNVEASDERWNNRD